MRTLDSVPRSWRAVARAGAAVQVAAPYSAMMEYDDCLGGQLESLDSMNASRVALQREISDR